MVNPLQLSIQPHRKVYLFERRDKVLYFLPSCDNLCTELLKVINALSPSKKPASRAQVCGKTYETLHAWSGECNSET